MCKKISNEKQQDTGNKKDSVSNKEQSKQGEN
jgi:hypothetical protein